MSDRRSMIGAGLLALMAVVDIIGLLTLGPPAVVLAIVLTLDVVLLVALGVWVAGRSRRTTMGVAVVAVGLSTLMALPPLVLPDFPVEERIYSAVFIVLAVVAVLLVRGELRRTSQGSPGPSARVA